MGLDMYIYKRENNQINKLLADIQNAKQADQENAFWVDGIMHMMLCDDETDNVGKIEHSIYWRKASHIHSWFSKHVLRNKKGIESRFLGLVSKQQLERLADRCEETLSNLITEQGVFEIMRNTAEKCSLLPRGFR